MSAEDAAALYFDLPTLRRVRGIVAGLDPAGEPEAVVLVTPPPARHPEGSRLKREGCLAGDVADGSVGGGAGGVSRPPGPPILGGESSHDTAASQKAARATGASSPQDLGAGGAAPRSDSSGISPQPSTHDSRLTTHDSSSVAIIAGSFDPPTNAHLALARAAREVGGCDAVYLALSRHTVDKEARTRPSDADRALLLAQIAAREPGLGVILFNRGLYADQAVAAGAAFPGAAISFVVGFDKARQIFDPRYYSDRDAALRQLFAHVSLLVAPRAEDGPDALVALLDRPENVPFRDAVRALPFDPAWSADSSTVVRAASRAGESFAALVPPETVAFIAALDPYAAPDPDGTPDRYERREALIARLADDPGAPVDLRRLLG